MYTFKEISLEEFEQFSQSQNLAAFVQSMAMAQVQQQQQKQALAYGVFSDETLIGAGLFILRPVIAKYTIAHCNQGPLLDYTNKELVQFFVHQVKDALKKHHVLHAVITPNFEVRSRDEYGELTDEYNHEDLVALINEAGAKHQGYENEQINGVGRFMFVKDFSEIKTEKELMSSLQQSARTPINKIKKMPYVIKNLTPQEVGVFSDIMQHTANRRDFSNRKPEFYASMMTRFNEKIKVLVAYLNLREYQQQLIKEEADLLEQKATLESNQSSKKARGRLNEVNSVLAATQKKLNELNQLEIKDETIPLAGSMFVLHANEMTYLYSGAYDQYFNLDAPYALQYEALKWGLENQISRYNMYGTLGKFCDVDETGVHTFKRGFNGKIIEQPGNFIIEVNPFMNKLYKLSRLVRK